MKYTSEGETAAKIQYLQRESKHDIEKPYYLCCSREYDIPRTNTNGDDREVSILNARNLNVRPKDLFFERGFASLQIPCELAYKEYLDPVRVRTVLYPRYKELARSLYPTAVRVEVLEHAVC